MPILIHYLLLALAIGLCTYLFLSVRRELRIVETRSLRRTEALRTQLREFAGELETISKEIEVMDQKSDPSATVARTLGSTVRIQALRMIKHGDPPEQIAGALNLPRTEVELLIKVQKLMTEEDPVPTA